MFKNNTAKKLYRLTKKANHKLSASTKDLNDSLDPLPSAPVVSTKHHTRTQSCPSGPPNIDPINIPDQQDTTRSFKQKPTHVKSKSQV